MRRRRTGGLLLAGALVLAACSGGGNKTAASSSSGPRDGGVLRVGIDRLKSLDPALALPTSQSQLLAADLLFDGLTAQPAGESSAVPALAESWKPSVDLKVWTFTLRSNAKFSNGRAVTAQDVQRSIERVAKLGESSIPSVRLDIVAGYGDFLSGAAPSLSGVKALNPSTVEISLTTAFASLPELLASPDYGIVPTEDIPPAAASFPATPVTSGPFSISAVNGDVIEVVRASGGRAHLDRIELHQYDDTARSYDDFTAAKLDFSFVPAARVDDATSRFGAGAIQPFQAELFYAFNLLDPTFSDVRFRQAIVKAVDRAALVKAVYPGIGQLLNGMVPAGVPGHVDDPCGSPCAFDPNAARDLAAQVFGPNPIPTVNIDYFVGTEEEAVASVISSSLAAVNIQTVKRPKPTDQYDQFAVSGQAQFFRLGAVGTYASADAYLGALFLTGSRDNATGFSDTTFDDLVRQARSTIDPTARVKLEQQAEQRLMSLVPVMPIAQFRTAAVAGKNVRDLRLSLQGTFDGTAVWLDG